MLGAQSLILAIGVLVILASIVWAIVDIMKSPWLQTADRAIWLVIVILLPLVGAAAWLLMRGSLTRREE